MKIEIFGPGCSRCKKLEENAREAVKKMKVKANIAKVTDMDKIIECGVMMTPALVIDGEVMSSGRIPEVEEIEKWLK